MANLEQLVLNGAVTLLNYLQRSSLIESSVIEEELMATALAGVLGDMLTQLEVLYPQVIADSGWQLQSIEQSSKQQGKAIYPIISQSEIGSLEIAQPEIQLIKTGQTQTTIAELRPQYLDRDGVSGDRAECGSEVSR